VSFPVGSVSVAFGSWWCFWFIPVGYVSVCIVLCGGGGASEFFPVRGFQIDSGAGEVFQPSALFFLVLVFQIGSYFLRFCSAFLVLVEFLFSWFWWTAVISCRFVFSVLFSGVLLCGSSGTGHTICGGDGLQVLFEFCTGGFLVAQGFWFSVAAAELAL
jgi:hypothetical protein